MIDITVIRDRILTENHKDKATEEQKMSYANGVLDFYNVIIKELKNGLET